MLATSVTSHRVICEVQGYENAIGEGIAGICRLDMVDLATLE